jgi:23S rRNA (adenine2503-C2)-methyltransferase
MGMGEPFLNYPNVSAAIEVMSQQKKIDLSSRRITISTCGIVPGIKKLAVDHPQISLALSLHAPNDEARSKIMPVDKNYPIPVLMEAIDEYTRVTNKRVFYEYIMINGVTDRLEYAHELAELLRTRLAHVNFIPYNPGEGIMGNGYASTPKIIVQKFQRVLEQAGVPSTIRHTMGDDIDAAC